jgi:Zn-finger nucleic acid-binding protein
MKVVRVERFTFPFEVDVCPDCRGFFLDKGETGKIAGGRDVERLLHDYAGDRGPAECPGCSSKMRLRTLKARGHAVTVDVCPDCRGTWLDGKELEQLKEAYEAYVHDHPGPEQEKPSPPSRALAASSAQAHQGPVGFAAMMGWAPIVK